MENIKKDTIIKVLAGIIVVIVLAMLVNNNINKKATVLNNSDLNASSTLNIASTTSNTSNVIYKNKTVKTVETVKVEYASRCGLTVEYPSIDSKIVFPLVVTGTIDNSNAEKLGCSWNHIADRGGTAQVFYNLRNAGWKPSEIPVPIMTSSGKTASSTAFSITLNTNSIAVGLVSGTPIKINFIEQGWPGVTVLDTFDLLLYYK